MRHFSIGVVAAQYAPVQTPPPTKAAAVDTGEGWGSGEVTSRRAGAALSIAVGQ